MNKSIKIPTKITTTIAVIIRRRIAIGALGEVEINKDREWAKDMAREIQWYTMKIRYMLEIIITVNDSKLDNLVTMPVPL